MAAPNINWKATGRQGCRMARWIPVSWFRGGTSKGALFLSSDLPTDPRTRDDVLCRIMGVPDPYGAQIDGLGGATSSTSKVALVAPSAIPGHDVDYHFGQVAMDGKIDWAGSCGNLAAAIGPFALQMQLPVTSPRTPTGHQRVNIWQANTRKTIIAHVPVALDGEVFSIGLRYCIPREIVIQFFNFLIYLVT